ncbi:MAG: phosphoadenosine phosphosulfate reductase family protein [Gammaproteobacteria bacterium]|nr:phosphoadenosine phosphosulfate reductase family protein [Gammaproteobacteria bacterium]
MSDKKTLRHLLGLSGGKDSAALAIYMRDKVPEMEYYFTDTGAELPETLEFVDLMEDYLGKEIVRLNGGRQFDYYLKLHNNFLPSAQQRWCTINLKLKPFEDFVGDDEVISYVGIRADEPQREGYISSKPNIKAVFPFKEDGLVKSDIIKLLEDSGLGLPKYYEWRSRSGCHFCFYQRKIEWIGLYENHPGLFEDAKKYEKYDEKTGKRYTWSQGESLDELLARKEEIKQKFANDNKKMSRPKGLIDSVLDDDDEDDDGCLICML